MVSWKSVKRKIQTAIETPFNNLLNGFTSNTVQEAIEEVGDNVIGFPRAGIPLVNNGTLGNNDLISYSNLTPEAPIIFPVKTKLNEVTFSNTRTGVSCNIEIWRGGLSGTLIKTINVNLTGSNLSQFFDLNADNIIFNAGEVLQLRYIDTGTNSVDTTVVLWISRQP